MAAGLAICALTTSATDLSDRHATAPRERLAITHGPFLQAPSDTGITVSWATSRRCVSSVEFRPDASKEWLTNTPAQHGLITADVTYHNVPLSGLDPGTRYVYRVVSREITDFQHYRVSFGKTIASREHAFTTLDPHKSAFSFVVVNDRHEKAAGLKTSFDSVNWAGVDLAFLNGDMVNAVKDEQQLFQCIVDPCAGSFAASTPVVYVRGNHDSRGSFARRLLDYFPTDSGRYYYTLQHGPVCFLILDCGEDKGDANPEYSGLVAFEPYLRQQAQWLAQAINQPDFQKAPFRVCLLHIPPGTRPDSKFIRPQWLLDNVAPLLNQGRVDLLICGHTHQYAIQPPGTDGLEFPMITGSGETVIRCEVSGDEIRTVTTALSGSPLPQLPPIRARGRK